jgi:hypothetical protein
MYHSPNSPRAFERGERPTPSFERAVIASGFDSTQSISTRHRTGFKLLVESRPIVRGAHSSLSGPQRGFEIRLACGHRCDRSFFAFFHEGIFPGTANHYLTHGWHSQIVQPITARSFIKSENCAGRPVPTRQEAIGGATFSPTMCRDDQLRLSC